MIVDPDISAIIFKGQRRGDRWMCGPEDFKPATPDRNPVTTENWLRSARLYVSRRPRKYRFIGVLLKAKHDTFVTAYNENTKEST